MRSKTVNIEKQDSSLHQQKPGGRSMYPPTTGLSFIDRQLIQRKENKTGMPDNLKSGVESLSGHDMSDVKVHYNSSKPAQLNALAYAQGSQIHIAPGQEKHLPHEAWHVAQQKQGRVRPTMQVGGTAVNNDKVLEKEADNMGSSAMQFRVADRPVSWLAQLKKASPHLSADVFQGKFITDEKTSDGSLDKTTFLHLLKARIYEMANQVLAQIHQTASDCPYLARWFDHYAQMDAAYVEQAIKRYAPQSQAATTVDEYIESIVNRVRGGLQAHVKTGTTAGVPAELIEEEHNPEDFQHIASRQDVVQRSCLTDKNTGNNREEIDTTDYESIYKTATPISPMYDNVRYFNDSGEGKIIKLCPGHEQACFKTMSGMPNFPVYYGGRGDYCIISFIGDYPTPAPTVNVGVITTHLEQAASICIRMAEKGISHGDLDNNMLFYAGQLYVIDFGASRVVGQQTALEANVDFVKRFLKKEQSEALDKMIQSQTV